MKLNALSRGKERRGRGQALVEFALVFPLIALLLFSIFDLGRAVYAYNTVANAAREAARVAAVNQAVPSNANSTKCHEDMPVEDPTNPDWSIKACAAQSAIALGVKPSDVTVSYSAPASTPGLSCTVGALSVGCIATVTVHYTWTPITPVVSNLTGSITLTSTSQMPIERVFP